MAFLAGRLRHFAEITSPLTLFASSTDLKNAQKLLHEYQEGIGQGRQAWGHEDTAGIWKAKQRELRHHLLRTIKAFVSDGASHLTSRRLFSPSWYGSHVSRARARDRAPADLEFFSLLSRRADTGEAVPLPFRLSAFVPTNLLIVGGMLMPNPTLKSVIFWQWANQSLNGQFETTST